MQFPLRHFSLNAHSWSAWHTGRHILSLQVLPSEQSELDSQETGTKNDWKTQKYCEYYKQKNSEYFSLLPVRNLHLLRTHSTSWFPVNPGGQLHCLLWLNTRHSAFIPHAERWSHGLLHCPCRHLSVKLHSSSDWQDAEM